jgi:hypothetical protein
MTNLAFELKNAKLVQTRIRVKFDLKSDKIQDYVKYSNAVESNKEFSGIQKLLWKEREGNLYDKLILYVERNISYFP